MSLFTSSASHINHVDQQILSSPTTTATLRSTTATAEDLSQLLIKQFLSQNKSIIEGNQFLIDELRKLRETITKQNVCLPFHSKL